VVRDLAQAKQVNETYISRYLRLTLRPPDMVEAILGGRQLEVVTLPRLTERMAIEW
jgi:hypothetical protein